MYLRKDFVENLVSLNSSSNVRMFLPLFVQMSWMKIFWSRKKNPVNYIQDFPLLKTAVESYTRRMYTEFEEEFKCQFSYSCKLLQTEGSISTFMVTHMHSNCGAIVAFNIEDNTITCSCRKFESIGMRTCLKLLLFPNIYC
jgi:hypothetical protein